MSRSRRKQLEAIPEDLLAPEGPGEGVGPLQEMLQHVDGLEAAGVAWGSLAPAAWGRLGVLGQLTLSARCCSGGQDQLHRVGG